MEAQLEEAGQQELQTAQRTRAVPPLPPAGLLPHSRPGELDLFALLLLLRAHLLRTVLFATLGFLLMVAYTATLKPRFASSASILIPQQGPSAASLALQAVGALNLLGGGNEVYLDILKSRSVADPLIAQYDLQKHYNVPELPAAEGILASHSTMTSSKEGLLVVTVQDEDPKMAANLANSYLTQLDSLNLRLAISSAGQQRRYYEQEMVKEKDALANAEVALRQSQEKTGVFDVQSQAQANVGAVENTRAQLRASQIQLEGLLQGATPQNPEVVRLRSQIAGLEGQLQAMQTGGGPAAGTPAAKVPAQALDFIRASREVKFHEALFDMLARQYESAKQQEAKDISMVEILDPAIPSRHKAWPPRTLYCLMGLALGGLFGILYTLLESLVRKILANPENRARYRALARGKQIPKAPEAAR